MRKPKNNLLKKLQNPFNAGQDSTSTNSFDHSRRDFLKNSGRLGLGAAISGLLPECVYSGNIQPGIAIIGAGIAGLNAANYLKKAGIKAQIFEADTKRAGGRMFTDRGHIIPGLTAEIGGEFIDSNHTEMFQLMADFGLRSKDVESDRLYFKDRQESYFIGNRFYSEKQVEDAFAPYRNIIANHLKGCGDSFNTPLAKHLDNLSISAYLADELKMDGWLKSLLNSAFCSEFGIDPDHQSAINFIDIINTDADADFKMYGTSDEIVNIQGGNDSLIKAMVNSLDGQINYGYQLSAIQQKGKKYLLSFANRKEQLFDMVIICIPFSVLKNVDLERSGLSNGKKNVINKLSYGTNSKVIMGFDERVWREKYHATGYVFNEIINNGWDASRMQTNNTGPGLFTCFIGGKAGKEVADKYQDHHFLEQKYLNQLEQIYPGTKAAYLNKGKKMIVADWPNQPGVKGSYACYLPGQWTSIHSTEGTPENNIYFAGEHCSQQFQGFMNGGAETGKAAALAIIKKIV